MRAAIVFAIATVAATATATAEPTALAPQAHAALGLSVVGVGYERPVWPSTSPRTATPRKYGAT